MGDELSWKASIDEPRLRSYGKPIALTIDRTFSTPRIQLGSDPNNIFLRVDSQELRSLADALELEEKQEVVQ